MNVVGNWDMIHMVDVDEMYFDVRDTVWMLYGPLELLFLTRMFQNT